MPRRGRLRESTGYVRQDGWSGATRLRPSSARTMPGRCAKSRRCGPNAPRPPGERRGAPGEHGGPVTYLEGGTDVLFDEQDADAAVGRGSNGVEQPFED